MKSVLVFLVALLTWFSTSAQLDFTEEVAEVVRVNDSIWNPALETIVFTGSSSIRLWDDLKERFPAYHILNTGFGGSETTDLLLHLNNLVLRYNPVKVFIYEGDNDISLGKTVRRVIMTTQVIIENIQRNHHQTEIILISAKPSIVRWSLKGKYRRLNKKLAKLALQNEKVNFINVWDCMLSGKELRTDLFIEDGLHMNTLGYDLWYEQVKPFLPK